MILQNYFVISIEKTFIFYHFITDFQLFILFIPIIKKIKKVFINIQPYDDKKNPKTLSFIHILLKL